MKKSLPLFVLFLLIFTHNLQAQTQLWGTTQFGGASNFGVLYKISNGNNLTFEYEFLGGVNGGTPVGKLCYADNGNIYGTTTNGGTYGLGVCFKFNPITSTFQIIHHFSIATGSISFHGLTKGDDGNLYGTCYEGGLYGGGALFKISTINDNYSVLFDFNSSSGTYAQIGHIANNVLYGTCANNGANGLGTIFKYDLNSNTFNLLYNNDFIIGKGVGTILRMSNGTLIGTAGSYGDGVNPFGVLYSFDLSNNTPTVLHYFDSINGMDPTINFIEGNDGKIYGTTAIGGPSNGINNWGEGVLYSYDLSSNTYTVLYYLDSISNGSNNQSGILQSSDGLLYFATFHNSKVLSFNLNSNLLTIVDDFSNSYASDASSPLIEISTFTAVTSDNKKSRISTMPNPAQDYIMINNIDKAHLVTCTDILGREIEQMQLAGFGKTKVDVSTYPNVFFVKNNNGEVIKVMKN
jgi:uncharacterized repeat protein (TIGR03803 family)